MTRLFTEILGGAATAVFVGSYFCSGAAAIRIVQMMGALMWIGYGVLIGAMPVHMMRIRPPKLS